MRARERRSEGSTTGVPGSPCIHGRQDQVTLDQLQLSGGGRCLELLLQQFLSMPSECCDSVAVTHVSIARRVCAVPVQAATPTAALALGPPADDDDLLDALPPHMVSEKGRQFRHCRRTLTTQSASCTTASGATVSGDPPQPHVEVAAAPTDLGQQSGKAKTGGVARHLQPPLQPPLLEIPLFRPLPGRCPRSAQSFYRSLRQPF